MFFSLCFILLATCPCAVTSSPNLIGNLYYGGKCYLNYYVNPSIHVTQADEKCRSPTTSGCDGSTNACISGTGVGRLATFNNWTDYYLVTSQFNKPIDCVALGMQCSPGGHLTNYNPYANCNSSTVIPGSPTCSPFQNGTDAVIQGGWNNSVTGYVPGTTVNGYLCEARKIPFRYF